VSGSSFVVDRGALLNNQRGNERMIDPATAPFAALILRLCLGIMFIAHAMLKWRVFTLPGTIAFFKSLGLPGWFAHATIAVELVGAAALILGVCPRYVALLLIPLILGTIVMVHGKNGWLFSNKDGGWEYPAFWATALFVQFLLGDGMWTLVPSPSISAVVAMAW
jgi:putative oxidoreductase